MSTAITEQPSSESKTFNFCIGRPWPKSHANPDGEALSVYTYGSEVHHGTMADAERLRDYVNKQTDEENYIYKLIPV